MEKMGTASNHHHAELAKVRDTVPVPHSPPLYEVIRV